MAKKPKQFTNAKMWCDVCGFSPEVPAVDAEKFNGSKCWKCQNGHIYLKGKNAAKKKKG